MKSETILIIGGAIAAYIFISRRGDKGGGTGGSLDLPAPLLGAFQTGGDPYNPAVSPTTSTKTNDTPIVPSFDISPKIQAAMAADTYAANRAASYNTQAPVVGGGYVVSGARNTPDAMISTTGYKSYGTPGLLEYTTGSQASTSKKAVAPAPDIASAPAPLVAWGRGDISQMITYSMPDIWHPGQMFTGQTTGGVGVAINNLKEAATRRGMEFDAKKITIQNRNVKYG